MQIFYGDETNTDGKKHDFFIYGGIVVPSEHALSIYASYKELLVRLKVPENYTLKFNPGPTDFTHDEFIELKSEVLRLAVDNGCTLIFSLAHHGIALNLERAMSFGCNTVLYHFDCHLKRAKDSGLAILDRHSNRDFEGSVAEQLNTGAAGLPFSKLYELDSIVGFHFSAVGQTPFASIADVALGSFRFVVNHLVGGTRPASIGDIVSLLSPMLSRDQSGRVSELSVALRPSVVKSPVLRTIYEKLADAFAEVGLQLEKIRYSADDRGY